MEEREEMKKEININNNVLKIEANDDKIAILLTPAMPNQKYTKEFTLDEIKELLVKEELKTIKEVYDFLITANYVVLPEEKKIKINDKEIELTESALTNDEIIKSLKDRLKEMEEKNKQQCELINELKKSNKEKDKKIRKFENAYNKMKNEMYDLDDVCGQADKYKDEINIVYEMEEDGDCNLFGEKFVENNKDNIDLVIDGVKTNLTNKYTLKKGENNVKMIIKNKITNLSKMFCIF